MKTASGLPIVQPSTNCGAEGVSRDDRVSDRRRSEDDVRFAEDLLQIAQRHGVPAEPVCQLAGSCETPIQDADLSPWLQTLRGDARHLSRTDQGDDSIFDTDGGLQKSDRSVAGGRVRGSHTRDPADLGRDLGGETKQIRQGAARRCTGGAIDRGVPDLGRHLLLAFCKGV